MAELKPFRRSFSVDKLLGPVRYNIFEWPSEVKYLAD